MLIIVIADVEFMIGQSLFADADFLFCLFGEEAGWVIGDQIFKFGKGLLCRDLIPIKGMHLFEIGHSNLVLNIRNLFMGGMDLA